MKISRIPSPLKISINNEQLKRAQELKYPGSAFTEDGSIEREIETSIQRTTSITCLLAYFLFHLTITMDTKRQLMSFTFIPITVVPMPNLDS